MFFVVFCLSKSMKVSDHPPFVGFFSTLRLIKTAKRKKDYIFSSEIHMFGSSIKNEINVSVLCSILKYWNLFGMHIMKCEHIQSSLQGMCTSYKVKNLYSNSHILVRICLPKAVGFLTYYHYIYIYI